jgi:hypothetical protein
MALAQKRGRARGSSKKVKELAASMPAAKLRDFAKTKRKDLKENRAMTFGEFLNEAYVDSSGELRDFEFTPDEKFELAAFEDIEMWRDFLKEGGAYSIRHSIDGGTLTFRFSFNLERYTLSLDLDNGVARIQRSSSAPSKVELVLKDTLRDFADRLRIDGLEAVLYAD